MKENKREKIAGRKKKKKLNDVAFVERRWRKRKLINSFDAFALIKKTKKKKLGEEGGGGKENFQRCERARTSEHHRRKRRQ